MGLGATLSPISGARGHPVAPSPLTLDTGTSHLSKRNTSAKVMRAPPTQLGEGQQGRGTLSTHSCWSHGPGGRSQGDHAHAHSHCSSGTTSPLRPWGAVPGAQEAGSVVRATEGRGRPCTQTRTAIGARWGTEARAGPIPSEEGRGEDTGQPPAVAWRPGRTPRHRKRPALAGPALAASQSRDPGAPRPRRSRPAPSQRGSAPRSSGSRSINAGPERHPRSPTPAPRRHSPRTGG